MLMSNEESSELTEPCVGAFDDPASFVVPGLAAILVLFQLVVFAVENNQFDAALATPRATAWSRRRGRQSPATFFVSGDLWAVEVDFGERGFHKRNFCRRGTFQQNPQWKTAAVSQYHPLRSVAPLGLSNCRAPLVAGAKLSSRNISSRYGRPSRSSAPSSGRHTSSHTSCFSHCFNHRQQVVGDGYLPGRKRHADPVCSTHKMPSRQSRLGSPRTASPLLAPLWLRQQRPDQLHFASVNNLNRLLLMQQAHQTTPHTQKDTA
jgi:hypothetical protein